MPSNDLVLELLKLLVADRQELARQLDEKNAEADRLRRAIDWAAGVLPRVVKTNRGQIRDVLTFQQLRRKLAKVALPDGSE